MGVISPAKGIYIYTHIYTYMVYILPNVKKLIDQNWKEVNIDFIKVCSWYYSKWFSLEAHPRMPTAFQLFKGNFNI